MEKHYTFILLFLLFSFSMFCSHMAIAMKSDDGLEEWGYVEVREKARLFWWHYKSPHRVYESSRPWPIILWLSGGPGTSGTASGNFLQVGPRDENLLPRDSTWLRKADLLFVDSPVGSGFSYVESESQLAKTDEKIAIDLLTLLKELFNRNEVLQRSPLYIFGESYGGKIAAILGVEVLKSIEKRDLKLQLGGVALGSSSISPLDFVLTWGPLLKEVYRLDDIGLEETNREALKIKSQLENRKFVNASETTDNLQRVIRRYSNAVNLHKYLLDDRIIEDRERVDLNELMNHDIKAKLKIIPEDLSWGSQEYLVVEALTAEIMKPKIEEVDILLAKGINVAIYNGQLDIMCSPKGAELWVKKLKWDGLEEFLKSDRVPFYLGNRKGTETKGFKKSHKQLSFYWILNAGHGIPLDQPEIALQIMGEITGSPSTS